MKTLYHLGLHRTGSTSLQHFLLANQLELARQGWLFPPVTPQGQARLLAQACGRQSSGADQPVPRVNEYMGHNALAYRLIADQVADYVFPPVHEPMPPARLALHQVQDLCQQLQPDVLLFCSEDLARAALMAPETPQLFAAQFGQANVTLMATLRRPDEALLSWQCQRLKFGQPLARLCDEDLTPHLTSVHVDYPRALQPWLTTFPEAHRHITPYRDQQAAGGSVALFRQHCAEGQIGALPAGLRTQPDHNRSLPLALFEIARQGLEQLPAPRRWAMLTYLQAAAARLDLPADSEVDLLHPEQRRQLALAFAPLHARLCALTGRERFFEDIDEMLRPRPIDSLAAARTALPALRQDASQQAPFPELGPFLDKLRL